ncbi:non-canonical purine NTP pyrophosphatase [uncultured Bacteroides sp.]|jgi:XTP/dITP diphosphohydrolase|uniref:non-canonical purine NTP pyrophosphatase n=1 Tax=uncultured Bacteroides sp. TaxID=162156 RepID=UPI0025E6DE97|nr:non-canonical purine NTP pyrophosphatase [uncultured Bacteroides sp.]
MDKQIRFLSNNLEKIEEVRTILQSCGIEVIPNRTKIVELQTDDVRLLVKDKALKAFKKIGRPLIVEHTGLYIDKINGLPGGLTQIFWDTLQADKFAELFGASDNTSKATAKTIVCYVDGKKFKFFESEISGSIVNVPRGDRKFQWDCVFVPENTQQTFSEMTKEKKNTMSMRTKALQQFVEYLNNPK